MNWTAWLLLLLAAARITHLLADDVILEAPRDWLTKHTPGRLGYLWSCTWCVSVWVAGPAALLAWHEHWVPRDAWLGWAAWPALSYGVIVLEAAVEHLYGGD